MEIVEESGGDLAEFGKKRNTDFRDPLYVDGRKIPNEIQAETFEGKIPDCQKVKFK